MKFYLLITFLLLTVFSFAQDSIKPISKPLISWSKADSLLNLLAAKTGADTNAPAQQISDNFDNAFSLLPSVPKKGATQIAWLHYFEALARDLGLWAMSFVALIYYIKHKKLKALTGTMIILLIFGLSSCKTGSVVTNFTANSATVKENIGSSGAYVEETAVIHTGTSQFDTAGVLIIAPDNVTNNLLVVIKGVVCKAVPAAPICK